MEVYQDKVRVSSQFLRNTPVAHKSTEIATDRWQMTPSILALPQGEVKILAWSHLRLRYSISTHGEWGAVSPQSERERHAGSLIPRDDPRAFAGDIV
jgi:hypothetical protein